MSSLHLTLFIVGIMGVVGAAIVGRTWPFVLLAVGVLCLLFAQGVP